MSTAMQLNDWKIDNSAARPILTYKGCSVIEAEDAEFVLSAIKAALSAAEPQPTSSVAVKALEWEPSGRNGQSLKAAALGIDVFYRISGSPGQWTFIKPAGMQYLDVPGYETRKEAQEAAQADYDARIRSALSAQVQDMALLADDIEKLDVDYHVGEFYGLSDWAAFAAGINKGRAAAAELVRTKAPIKPEGA